MDGRYIESEKIAIVAIVVCLEEWLKDNHERGITVPVIILHLREIEWMDGKHT